MKRVVFAVLPFVFACNTAEVKEPPATDDGGTGFCQTDSLVERACDAGAITVGCAPDPDAAATAGKLAPGLYPIGCTISSDIINANGECQIVHECSCVAGSASDAGDAGASTGGNWVCLE